MTYCVQCASQNDVRGMLCKPCRDMADYLDRAGRRHTTMPVHTIKVAFCLLCGQPSPTVKCRSCRQREFLA